MENDRIWYMTRGGTRRIPWGCKRRETQGEIFTFHMSRSTVLTIIQHKMHLFVQIVS